MSKVYRIHYVGKMPPPISVEDTFFIDADSELEAMQIAFSHMGIDVVEDAEYRKEMDEDREGDYQSREDWEADEGCRKYHEAVDNEEEWTKHK